jgi:prepilin-type N-terminal cleavage/methylation domain-containing protein
MRHAAPPCEIGVTLIETLVVLAILGLITAAAAVPLNGAWQRSRLESSVGEVRNFLQVAYTEAINQRTKITVTLSLNSTSGNWELNLAPAPQRAPATYVVPDYVSSIDANSDTNWPTPSAGSRSLICDPKGLTLDPTNLDPVTGEPRQVTTTQTLGVTHVNMVDGSLSPNVEYDVQVFPLWNASSRRYVR